MAKLLKHFQMLGCSYRCTVFGSVHENASWLCKVVLTGLGLGVYDGTSLYVTTSDYFCYSYWFTTIRQTDLPNYTFKTDFPIIIWLLESRIYSSVGKTPAWLSVPGLCYQACQFNDPFSSCEWTHWNKKMEPQDDTVVFTDQNKTAF